jgi:hypothetical protein
MSGVRTSDVQCEVNHLERALDADPEVVPQLRALIRRITEDNQAALGGTN